MRSVVEIVTPAASELLTTLDRVKAELQVKTDAADEILEAKIAEASSDIQAAIGYRLPSEQVRETFWHDDVSLFRIAPPRHGNPAQTTLFLKRTPVSKIASITVDDVTLDAFEYRLDPDAGLLDRLRAAMSPARLPSAWPMTISRRPCRALGRIIPRSRSRPRTRKSPTSRRRR